MKLFLTLRGAKGTDFETDHSKPEPVALDEDKFDSKAYADLEKTRGKDG